MSKGPFSGKPRIATGSLSRGSARESGDSLRLLTRNAAISFFSSKTTTLAGRGMLVPSGWTWVTTSPATTWALVTTISGAATQPVPQSKGGCYPDEGEGGRGAQNRPASAVQRLGGCVRDLLAQVAAGRAG